MKIKDETISQMAAEITKLRAERYALKAAVGLLQYAQQIAGDDRYSNEAIGIAFRVALKKTDAPADTVVATDGKDAT